MVGLELPSRLHEKDGAQAPFLRRAAQRSAMNTAMLPPGTA